MRQQVKCNKHIYLLFFPRSSFFLFPLETSAMLKYRPRGSWALIRITYIQYQWDMFVRNIQSLKTPSFGLKLNCNRQLFIRSEEEKRQKRKQLYVINN